MKQRMSGLMAEEKLPYGSRTHTYNSRLAQELSKWGESFPEGEVLNRKLFEAYFVKGQTSPNLKSYWTQLRPQDCPVKLGKV